MKRPSGWTLILSAMCLIFLGAKVWLESGKRVQAPKLPALHWAQASYQSKSLKLYNLGFRNLISGLMWVDLLQRSDTSKLEANKVSWEYEMLDGITTLDPQFERAYIFGSLFLSVFRQDKEGARHILEKWVARSPISWRPNYMLGYHLMYEIGDQSLASKYFLRAAALEGAPYYVTSLGIRLVSSTAGHWQALKLATDLYADLQDEEAKTRLLVRIKSLNLAMQKEHWKKAAETFAEKTGHSATTIAELIPYYKTAAREVSSLSEKTAAAPELVEALNETYPFELDKDGNIVASQAIPAQLQQTGIYPKK